MGWFGIAPAHPRSRWNAGGQTAPNVLCDPSKAAPGAPWGGLELFLLIPGIGGMLKVKLLQMLFIIPQKPLLELLGLVWRELGCLEWRIQGWRCWRSHLECPKWNLMDELSSAQSWNPHFVRKGSLGITCVVPLVRSEFQGSGFCRNEEQQLKPRRKKGILEHPQR